MKCGSSDVEQCEMPPKPSCESIISCEFSEATYLRAGTEFNVDRLPPTVESIRVGWLSTFGSAASIVSRLPRPFAIFH